LVAAVRWVMDSHTGDTEELSVDILCVFGAPLHIRYEPY
jgi:hypothetical protein